MAARAAASDSADAFVSGSRTSGVGMRPCAWSTALNTAGFGSANIDCTTGSSASAWARPSSTLPASPHSIIETNCSVHTCADAQIAPAPPMSTIGKRNGSSPPSTAKSSGAPRSSSSVSRSRPVRLLDPDDVRVRRGLEHAGGARGADRCGTRCCRAPPAPATRRRRPEVGDDPGLRRAHVIRARRSGRPTAPGVPASACTFATVVAVLFVPGADDQLRAALDAHGRARVDDRPLLRRGQRGRLARGARAGRARRRPASR